MSLFQEIVFIVGVAGYLVMTVILIGNLIYLRRRPHPTLEKEPRVSILIPARNEASNLRRLLPKLASQSYQNLEVIVYDDESTDRTWEVIQQHRGGRISGIRGGQLPDGWLGKCHALHQAAQQAEGDVLLFLDADVLIHHDRVVERLMVEFLSLPPFRALTVMPGLQPSGGRLLVSLIPNSILLTIPWFVTRWLRAPSMAMLNGQCWMIHAEDYRSFNPHEKHRKEILEDVKIGRALVRSGMRIHLIATKGDVDVRMYETIDQAWRGFRKNAYLLFGGTPIRFLLLQMPFLFFFLIAPIIDPPLLLWLYLLKYGSDRVAGFKAVVTLLAPVSYVAGLILDWDSAIHHWRGDVTWKGRSVV